jgi:CHAT domain-containing protein
MTSKLIPNIALSFIAIIASSALPLNTAIALEKSPTSLKSNFLLTQTTSNSISTEKIKQVAKNQNATLVQYSLLNEETQESELAIWVIKPTGEITMRRIDLKAWQQKEKTSLVELITKTRNQIGVGSNYNKGIITVSGESREKPSPKSWKQLHQVLIQPIADLLPKQPEERVIFIPQNQLFLVPFAALQDNNSKYLIEKHTISTAPSVQALDLLYQRKIKRQGEQSFVPGNMKGDELLIVGNPTAPKVSLKPGENPFQLSSMPGAEQEAKAIAEMFTTEALTGNEATETAILERMPQAKIIHLATHTVELNNSNVIALAASNQDDGWLSVEEIQKLNLKADLVVLSAENTALGKITGDGVMGLSRAFFVAGADSVVGTLWEANDMTMAFLMT